MISRMSVLTREMLVGGAVAAAVGVVVAVGTLVADHARAAHG